MSGAALRPRMAVFPGVQLDRRDSHGGGMIHGTAVGIDEQADPAPRLPEPVDCRGDATVASPAVKGQTALSRDFLAAFRYDGGLVRPQPDGDPQDVEIGRA